jgi:hypothetical protein
VIAGSLCVLVTAGVGRLVYAVQTPTTTFFVVDDLNVAASLGDTVAIDPNVHDSNGACAVYAEPRTFTRSDVSLCQP